MRLMVIGSGGREHALIRYLKRNPKVETIYALPGNGGIGREAQCVDIKALDIDGIVRFAVRERIDFAVVAPDDPLALGAVDALHAAGIRCFGPEAKAAVIESSKAFAKELMRKYGIPTARYRVFDDYQAAQDYLRGAQYPAVIKADGLALGKGVIIANGFEEALAAVRAMMVEHAFGRGGSRVVIEEFLTGPEVSVLAFTDGVIVKPLAASMDHKRALDGDEGPNTGGMGVIAPNPFYTPDMAQRCMEEIFVPTIRAMNEEGRRFRGCLYFGLMLTPDGPKVIEYNCRFGDPETQAVLPLLQTDLLTVMEAVEDGRLSSVPVLVSQGASCCVVMASGGYPGRYETGKPITFGNAQSMEGIEIFHAGTRFADKSFHTSGGRVLGVTAVAGSLREAVKNAYAAVDEIRFDKNYYRKDIGRSALTSGEG